MAPKIGQLPFLGVRYSTLEKVADAQRVRKKTYNNLVSTIRRVFEYGYRDHPEQHNPAAFMKCVRIRRRDRPSVDPFSIAEADSLIAAIHARWGEAQGNYDELRFFSGLRPSEQIALLVSDFDASPGILSVTKSRTRHVTRDCTKTGEARDVELCPRALLVLSRQFVLRERLKQAGRINHEYLFFDRDGQPLPDTKNSYRCRGRTFDRLQIPYRKPYVARHSFVSWNLMIGRNPVRLAQLHGHSLVTMLSTYGAWPKSAREDGLAEIRRAIYLSEDMPG